MSDPVYKMIELTGTSTTSIEEAVNNAIARSSETVRQIGWFEVVEVRGRVEGSAVMQWQVTVKVGFKLEG
jgi:flavin-binding protein dodecin